MLKLTTLALGGGLLYGLYTGKLTWTHCDTAAGLDACWASNPITLTALIIFVIASAIVVVRDLKR